MSDLQNFKRIAVHAKQLFLHAFSHAGSSQPVDQMIALHDMHNAVEWLLSGMWVYYHETADKPEKFMEVYDKISQGKQRLILRRELRLLNEARNNAQHHALAPSTAALQKHLGHCEAFLRQSMRDLSPECEYDELYMGLLLPEGLISWVRWNDFSDDWISLLGGRKVSAPDSFYSEDAQWRARLDLRTMVIQAERMLPEARSENDLERRRAIRLVMNILAACLVYAQNLALTGTEYPPFMKANDCEEKATEAVTRSMVSIGPQGSPFPLVGEADINIRFGVGELLEVLSQCSDPYDRIE